MNETKIVKMFNSLGFNTLEYNIDRFTEVKDFGYFARFGNDKHQIQFIYRDGEVLVEINKYEDGSLNHDIKLNGDVFLVMAQVVKEIKKEYKGEIQ